MDRTKLLQEYLIMRFEKVYGNWNKKRLTQEEAARILGVSDRTFRRYLVDYKDKGLQGFVKGKINSIGKGRENSIDKKRSYLIIFNYVRFS